MVGSPRKRAYVLNFEGGGGRGDRQPSKTSNICSFSRVEVGVVVVVVWAKRDHPDGGGGGDKEPPSKMSPYAAHFRGQGLQHDEEGFTPPGHVGNGIWCDEEG